MSRCPCKISASISTARAVVLATSRNGRRGRWYLIHVVPPFGVVASAFFNLPSLRGPEFLLCPPSRALGWLLVSIVFTIPSPRNFEEVGVAAAILLVEARCNDAVFINSKRPRKKV